MEPQNLIFTPHSKKKRILLKHQMIRIKPFLFKRTANEFNSILSNIKQRSGHLTPEIQSKQNQSCHPHVTISGKSTKTQGLQNEYDLRLLTTLEGTPV